MISEWLTFELHHGVLSVLASKGNGALGGGNLLSGPGAPKRRRGNGRGAALDTDRSSEENYILVSANQIVLRVAADPRQDASQPHRLLRQLENQLLELTNRARPSDKDQGPSAWQVRPAAPLSFLPHPHSTAA
jgi:hypothetical protein